MSFAGFLVPVLHLLISASHFGRSGGSLSSLEMKELLFVTKRPHSAADLVHEFFNRTLLPSCDLTANLCDVNCCNDKDCDEDLISAFTCKGVEPFWTDPILSDPMYCHSVNPTIDPILCYETENSPFLGVYFMEDRVLKRKWMETHAAHMWAARHFPVFQSVQPLREKYVYGVPLLLSNKEVVRLPRDILGKGCCGYDAPVRFLADTDSLCVTGISPELCTNNPNLRFESYFRQSDDGFEPPEILSSGGPIRGNLTVGCRRDKVDEDIFVVRDMLEECGNASKIARPEYDPDNRVCRHVVTRVEYHLTWHENALVALEVLATLTDVPLARPASMVPSRRNARMTQIFTTTFHRLETDSGQRKHDSYRLNDEILLHLT